MKRLDSIETDQVQLEIIECDCGYHMGIDATFLEQVWDFITSCPACGAIINTPEPDLTEGECFRFPEPTKPLFKKRKKNNRNKKKGNK